MQWIVRNDTDITVSNAQMQERREFIRDVTGSNISAWQKILIKEREFFICTSDDDINGMFITAHRGDILLLCSLREVCLLKFVVANTCIWGGMIHIDLLQQMRLYNTSIELYFAKQDLSVENCIFRKTTTIKNVGEFNFPTSRSERELYRNRKKGVKEAIRKSFDKVSPIILLKDVV